METIWAANDAVKTTNENDRPITVYVGHDRWEILPEYTAFTNGETVMQEELEYYIGRGIRLKSRRYNQAVELYGEFGINMWVTNTGKIQLVVAKPK